MATVLVVDDDPDTLELLQSTLVMAGAKPVGATSVADAHAAKSTASCSMRWSATLRCRARTATP